MNIFRIFRIVAIVEAISNVVMFANMALPERLIPKMVTGSVHGGLLLLFCFLLLAVMLTAKWSLKTAFLVFLSALVPFVPFFVDKWLGKEEKRVMGEALASED